MVYSSHGIQQQADGSDLHVVYRLFLFMAVRLSAVSQHGDKEKL